MDLNTENSSPKIPFDSPLTDKLHPPPSDTDSFENRHNELVASSYFRDFPNETFDTHQFEAHINEIYGEPSVRSKIEMKSQVEEAKDENVFEDAYGDGHWSDDVDSVTITAPVIVKESDEESVTYEMRWYDLWVPLDGYSGFQRLTQPDNRHLQ